MIRVKNDKKKHVRFGVEVLILGSREDPDFIFHYRPFRENDVLCAESTENEIIMLLKNGTVIAWGCDPAFGSMKIDTAWDFAYQLNIPTRVVNISCGRDHIMAKGINHRIYSWGSNNYNQLGHSSDKLYVYEPTEIILPSSDKVDTIIAKGDSSFAVTDKKEIYAWGKVLLFNIESCRFDKQG
jgi:alpha-tubulin suppressor-like RCC1 family protein